MNGKILLLLAAALVPALVACGDRADSAPIPGGSAEVPPRAEDVAPRGVGEVAPAAVLRTQTGGPLDLRSAYAQGPTLLIFYRGGWCPFCSAHLGEIAMMEDELQALGVRVLAVSPDRPERLLAAVEDRQLGYQLLSDSDMSFTRSFGLAFTVDDETVQRYAGSRSDLQEASGHDHHQLPVPAVYLIDTDGIIRFAYWDPNYRERIDPGVLMATARELVE
jgi:peroxiredoxin